LRTSYLECKRLNSLHGKTYYLATLLLPPEKRPFVHALYGFARYADEIVDDLASTLTDDEKANSLKQWGEGVISDIKSGNSDDVIGKALVDTVKRFDIPIQYFQAFLHSMAMDLTITEYQEYEDLQEYVYGSAAVIGLQMVSVLGIEKGFSINEVNAAAEKLGVAFQLANFIRDVGEDLDRGRVYLPIAELQAHGVTREMLERKVLTPQIKSALKEQIERVRKLQQESMVGINMLAKQSRACIQAASELYCGIVDEVEKIDYQIFSKRAKTSNWRRMKVAIPAYLSARSSR
jgi:phytoene synthase